MTKHQSIEQIRRVKVRHQRRLLDLANVVGVGIGLKETGGITTNQPAIVVNVSQKLPLAQLAPVDVVPVQLDDIPTDVQATGQFTALQSKNDAAEQLVESPTTVVEKPAQSTSATVGANIYRQLANSLNRLFQAGSRHDS